MSKYTIIDDHVLFGRDYWLFKNKPERDYYNDNPRMVKLGYVSHLSFIMPFPSSENNVYFNENLLISKAAIEHKCYVPVFAFNPYRTANIEQVSILLKHFPVAGIIIWPILCGIDLDKLKTNQEFISLLESKSNNPNFFVCIHTGAGNEKDIGRVGELGHYLPEDVVNVAEAFSKTKFILTHLLRFSIPSLERAAKLKNIMIDTNGLSCQKRWFENGQNVFPSYDAGMLADMGSNEALEHLIVKMNLSKKLIFGSSFPYSLWWNFNLENEIKLITKSNITEQNKNDILYKNLERFLPQLEEKRMELSKGNG